MKKIATIIMLCIISIITFTEGNTKVYARNYANYYLKDNASMKTNNGYYLYSHAERQMYGITSEGGIVRKVKFYVYAKYVGNGTVKSIKCAWRTGATLRKSATLTLSTSAGKDYSFSAGASSTYSSVESKEKYWESTNGSKVEYENSNFTIAPDRDLKGYLFWIKTTATVKIKGYAKANSINCGV